MNIFKKYQKRNILILKDNDGKEIYQVNKANIEFIFRKDERIIICFKSGNIQFDDNEYIWNYIKTEMEKR